MPHDGRQAARAYVRWVAIWPPHQFNGSIIQLYPAGSRRGIPALYLPVGAANHIHVSAGRSLDCPATKRLRTIGALISNGITGRKARLLP
jgi:hypothetical protein